jgi:hypothetical protein
MIMDRLPLVQALTAAGLERHGAEQVATALGEAIEATVASKADITRLEGSMARLEARMDASMARLEARMDASIARVADSVVKLSAVTDARFAEAAATTRADLAALEHRLLVRLGGLMVTGGGILFAALRFGGHAP